MPYALRSKKIIYIIFILGFAGFLDSVYLTILHYAHAIPPCTVTHGCETVLTSRFATVGPIPTAAFGIAYFLIIMVLALRYMQTQAAILMKSLFFLASLAIFFSLVLTYIQAFVLESFCQYCLVAELCMLLIFLLAGQTLLQAYQKARKK
jgi:vitamin-K-epoxide reductase (warfarin-sensitive)